MAKGKCIIVCSDGERPIANLLLGLISEKGDYEAAVWTDAVFTSNMPSLSSTTKLILISKSKIAKNHHLSVEWKYDDDGKKYGWLANRAVLHVEDLTNYIKDKNTEVSSTIKSIDRNEKPHKKVVSFFKPIANAIADTSKVITTNITSGNEEYKEQFKILINRFVESGLSEFMEA
jgi:hypothetical protein